MTDPRFPDRPDHPEFWVLAQVLIDMDAVSDNNTMTYTDHVGQIIDAETLRYVAQQRSARGINIHGHILRNLTRSQIELIDTWITATWCEAFFAGARYQAAKMRQADADDQKD